MATIVFVHAHPDDEAIATGGTMAKAAAAGHRVVLVSATKGELGEVPDGFLDEGETLEARRVQETHAAARVLGVARTEFLGYYDSGMDGEASNADPSCFWQAGVEEAAERLAAILRDENADAVTVYDEYGNYGHPDHIQVHRVGVRAAELAGTPRVYESTLDRDRFQELMKRRAEFDLPDLPDTDGVDEFNMGVPGALITTRVDVSAFLDQKREAMRAHASQISETSFFLAMPPDAFAAVWGQEDYVLRPGAPDDLLQSL